MQKSLVNTFLGIFTTSEVHELVDIFKGKGRRRVTPFLESYLESVSQNECELEEDNKHALLHSSLSEEKGSASDFLDNQDQASELKGVLFILDSFRRTRKYQNILKSREVLSLYNRASNESLSSSGDEVEGSSLAKSKGILINKKHY